MKAPPLRLLLPPLRLLTAAAWQVVRQRSVRQYGMLEEFVSTVTEAVPQLLTDRQRGLLLLALRAKATLADPAADPAHLERIRSVAQTTDQQLSDCGSALLAVSTGLTERPADCQRLLQEAFGPSFDSALQALVSDLLSRLEQLFPVPDFRQAASLLHGAPCALEESLQETERTHLRELLTNQSWRLGRATTAVGPETEEKLLAAWSHPLLAKPAPAGPAGQSEQREAVVGLNVLEEEPEAPNESSEGGGVTPVCSQSAAASHNPQRVAHRCPGCGRCFIYRSQVISHLRSNQTCRMGQRAGPEEEPRPIPSHTCFQCGSAYGSGAELQAHRRSHRARPVYRCGRCGSAFLHLSSLTDHRQAHQDGCGPAPQELPPPRRRRLPRDLSCSVCAQTFGTQALLLRHLQAHAAQGADCVYGCLFCDESFPGVTQLRIHQRSHSRRSHRCEQCGKAYSSGAGLQAHRASHGDDGGRFLCSQCGKRFKTRDGLEGHLRTHRGERPFRCPHCPKAFAAPAGLNVHVRRHTGERPYVCGECGKAWPSGGDLQKHMRTHTGERPYACLDCGKAFSISCHLTEHRRIHTGEKPFGCPECGKCFRRRFDLNKHLLSHSSVRPHACSFCPKSYTRQTHLNRHLLTHRAAGEGAAGEGGGA